MVAGLRGFPVRILLCKIFVCMLSARRKKTSHCPTADLLAFGYSKSADLYCVR